MPAQVLCLRGAYHKLPYLQYLIKKLILLLSTVDLLVCGGRHACSQVLRWRARPGQEPIHQ